MEKEKEEKLEVVRPYGDAEIERHAARVGGRRNLRELTIISDGAVFHYLIKKPSRAVMQAVTDAEQRKNIGQVQKLMMGCVLEGDADAYEHDGSIYIRLLEGISELVDTATADIKKL